MVVSCDSGRRACSPGLKPVLSNRADCRLGWSAGIQTNGGVTVSEDDGKDASSPEASYRTPMGVRKLSSSISPAHRISRPSILSRGTRWMQRSAERGPCPRSQYLGGMASTRASVAYDRVQERRRAVALAQHFREAEGLSIAQIAQRLGRSPATIKAYFYDPSDDNKRPADSPVR
jgi:Homeodomain-like domain